MIQIHQVEQGSEEWLQLRADLYTGSGADKLLKFATSLKLVGGEVSSYSLAEITGFGGNFHTRRGHILEDEAIELYQAITGHTVSKPGFVTNSDYPNCGFSPDGHDDDIDAILEVKAFEESKHMKMFKGDIPLKVLAQIFFGMFIWRKRAGRLLIYNPDLEAEYAFKIITITWKRTINDNFKRVLSHAR